MLHWLLKRAAKEPTLFGFDFSFAPPIVELGEYLLGEPSVPKTAREFWAYVDGNCDDEDLGAASFLEIAHRRHFYFGIADGVKADFVRFRQCDARLNAQGGRKTASAYDAIGAAQVAKASFSGMRLLHHLDGKVAIFPMDPLPGQRQRGGRNLHPHLPPPRRHARHASCAPAPSSTSRSTDWVAAACACASSRTIIRPTRWSRPPACARWRHRTAAFEPPGLTPRLRAAKVGPSACCEGQCSCEGRSPGPAKRVGAARVRSPAVAGSGDNGLCGVKQDKLGRRMVWALTELMLRAPARLGVRAPLWAPGTGRGRPCNAKRRRGVGVFGPD